MFKYLISQVVSQLNLFYLKKSTSNKCIISTIFSGSCKNSHFIHTNQQTIFLLIFLMD
jgi:hypothetical protein